MPDSRNVALAALLALTAACTSNNSTPATTVTLTVSATAAPTTRATAAPSASASAAPVASTTPPTPAIPGAADALAFLDTSYRACDAYIRKNNFGEPIGYPDPTNANEAFHFTVLAVGPAPRSPPKASPPRGPTTSSPRSPRSSSS